MKKLLKNIVLRGVKVALKKGSFDYDAAAVDAAKKQIRKLRLRYPVDENSFAVFKRSVDARKKDGIAFVYSVIFSLKEEILLNEEKYSEFSAFCTKHGLSVIDREEILFCDRSSLTQKRPVVAGFGPCGMFIALVLSRCGLSPIVIERGSDADKRTEKVSNYWEEGSLDTECNVQFGEGGAGTFSDGKLMTRINDKLCTFVLETLYEHGADKDILYNAKPHVGTDKLRNIVKNIRNKIESYGGSVHFDTKLTGITKKSDGSLRSVITNKGEIETDTLFLAIGHSARDTFMMLMESGMTLTAKPFSVGVRVEHLQKDIDRALYGDEYENEALPSGEYALSRRFSDRAVYSFCMCPGGTVVASASENGTIVTNGMSYAARDGKNANSAIAVSINESDFGGDVISAIEYQRNIERAAFLCAGSDGSAPIENLGHFLGKAPLEITKVQPTYTGKTKLCSLAQVFPEYITNTLKEGFLSFEKQIEGFSSSSAILTAPETRTSSPVRIPRRENAVSLSCKGIYPCGEGAGYAGGITSAAVDGVRCALTYMENLKNEKEYK